MMLSILFVGLVAVSAVGAADNVTDDNVSVDNNDVNHVELTNDNSSFEENSQKGEENNFGYTLSNDIQIKYNNILWKYI